jgi:hypothetical protein
VVFAEPWDIARFNSLLENTGETNPGLKGNITLIKTVKILKPCGVDKIFKAMNICQNRKVRAQV